MPGQSASAPDQSRVDCRLAPTRLTGSSMPAQTSPPPNSASFAFCASSRPSAVLSGRSPSKPVVRKIWGRKMPQVHARGIFLPQFFCPAVWENSPAARQSDSRYLRDSAAPREPGFEWEAREDLVIFLGAARGTRTRNDYENGDKPPAVHLTSGSALFSWSKMRTQALANIRTGHSNQADNPVAKKLERPKIVRLRIGHHFGNREQWERGHRAHSEHERVLRSPETDQHSTRKKQECRQQGKTLDATSDPGKQRRRKYLSGQNEHRSDHRHDTQCSRRNSGRDQWSFFFHGFAERTKLSNGRHEVRRWQLR